MIAYTFSIVVTKIRKNSVDIIIGMRFFSTNPRPATDAVAGGPAITLLRHELETLSDSRSGRSLAASDWGHILLILPVIRRKFFMVNDDWSFCKLLLIFYFPQNNTLRKSQFDAGVYLSDIQKLNV